MKWHIALAKLSTLKMPELVGHVPIFSLSLKVIPQILFFCFLNETWKISPLFKVPTKPQLGLMEIMRWQSLETYLFELVAHSRSRLLVLIPLALRIVHYKKRDSTASFVIQDLRKVGFIIHPLAKAASGLIPPEYFNQTHPC